MTIVVDAYIIFNGYFGLKKNAHYGAQNILVASVQNNKNRHQW
jgi:hypothetical protein